MHVSKLFFTTLILTIAAVATSIPLNAETTTPDGRHTISYGDGALEVDSIDKFTKLKKRVLYVPEAQMASFDETLTKMQEWRDVAEENDVKNFKKSKRMVWGQKRNTQAIDFDFKTNAEGTPSVYVAAKFGPSCNNPADRSILACSLDVKGGSGILNFDDIEAIHAVVKDLDNFKAQPKTDDLFQ